MSDEISAAKNKVEHVLFYSKDDGIKDLADAVMLIIKHLEEKEG